MYDGDEVNHDDMDDDALDAMRRALSDLHAPGPPPLEAIAAKAQALRRRRRSGLAAAGSAAVAVAITAALLAATGHPATTHLGTGPVHVNLADFSVDSNSNGTVRLDLRAKQALDAPRLASVLAQAGVPAVVRVGAFCGPRPSRRLACTGPSPISWPEAQVRLSRRSHPTAKAVAS